MKTLVSYKLMRDNSILAGLTKSMRLFERLCADRYVGRFPSQISEEVATLSESDYLTRQEPGSNYRYYKLRTPVRWVDADLSILGLQHYTGSDRLRFIANTPNGLAAINVDDRQDHFAYAPEFAQTFTDWSFPRAGALSLIATLRSRHAVPEVKDTEEMAPAVAAFWKQTEFTMHFANDPDREIYLVAQPLAAVIGVEYHLAPWDIQAQEHLCYLLRNVDGTEGYRSVPADKDLATYQGLPAN